MVVIVGYNLNALASRKAEWHVSTQHKSFTDFIQSTKLFSFQAATFCLLGDAAALASTKSLHFRQERRLAFPPLGGQCGSQHPQGLRCLPPFAVQPAFLHASVEAPHSSADVREPTISGNPASPKALWQTACTATQTTVSSNCTIKQSFTQTKLNSCLLL